MSEYQVLHGEPRHKVDDFVDEVLTRCRVVIADMGLELEKLLKDMIGQFQAFRERHYLLTLKDVRFEQCRWVKDGQLVIDFSVEQNIGGSLNRDELRHAVVDEFVDGVVGRQVPEELRDEFSQFLRGMVTQFAALKKHAPVDLNQVRFERVAWLDDRHLAIRMLHRGKPLLPQDVRFV